MTPDEMLTEMVEGFLVGYTARFDRTIKMDVAAREVIRIVRQWDEQIQATISGSVSGRAAASQHRQP